MCGQNHGICFKLEKSNQDMIPRSGKAKLHSNSACCFRPHRHRFLWQHQRVLLSRKCSWLNDGWGRTWTLSACFQTSSRPISISNIWDRFENSSVPPVGSTSTYSKLRGSKSNITTGHCQDWNTTGIEESSGQEKEALGWYCLGGEGSRVEPSWGYVLGKSFKEPLNLTISIVVSSNSSMVKGRGHWQIRTLQHWT